MIIDAIQGLAQVLAKSSQTANGPAERQASLQLLLTPGQQVQAELMASLPNHRYIARIAGKLFNIELPIIIEPGETLQLTYVSEEPNLTFTLSRSGNGSTPVTLSDAAKLLSQLSTTDPKQAGAVGRGGAILNGAPTDTSIFAELLGEALSLNGIFYESHLLQWFCGERSIRDILREPQGRLSKRLKAKQEGGMQGVEEDPPGLDCDEPMADELCAALKGDGAADARTLPIVHEQLETLRSGQVIWQGEVWPRQEMEWSVRDERKGRGDGVEKSWLSTLRLELPNLGRVEATVRLGKEGVAIRLDTEKEQATSLMREERESLAEALSAAGIRLLEMVVSHEEDGE